MFEREFNLYVRGVYFGRVWLRSEDLSDLEQLGRAVSGLRRYKSKARPIAIYVEVL